MSGLRPLSLTASFLETKNIFFFFFFFNNIYLVTTLLMTILTFTWRKNENKVQGIKEKYDVKNILELRV